MTMVLVFEEKVMRVICTYEPQMGRSDCEKNQFYSVMACEWDLQNPGKMTFDVGDTADTLGDWLMVLRVCMVDMELA